MGANCEARNGDGDLRSPRRTVKVRPTSVSGKVRPSLTGAGTLVNRSFRLTEPMVRDNGGLRVATWEEALDRAARGFSDVVKMSGPTAFGMFSCSKTTNEFNYIAQKFARVVVG